MSNVHFDIQLSGCAIIVDGKLLLLKKFKNDYYEFPGGKVNPGEEIMDAAIREVKEEIGCEVKIIEKFGVFDFSHKEKNVRSNIFIAETEDEPRIIEEDIFERIIWMPILDYKKYELASNVEYFCKNYKT